MGAALGTAVDLSEGESWAQAKSEWRVLYEDDAGGPTETCVCDYEGLRYLNMVGNRITGARLYPVGSSCVERFGVDRIAEEQADARAVQCSPARGGRRPRPAALLAPGHRRAAPRRVIDAAEHALMRRLFNKGPKAQIPEHDAALLRAVVSRRVMPTCAVRRRGSRPSGPGRKRVRHESGEAAGWPAGHVRKGLAWALVLTRARAHGARARARARP